MKNDMMVNNKLSYVIIGGIVYLKDVFINVDDA